MTEGGTTSPEVVQRAANTVEPSEQAASPVSFGLAGAMRLSQPMGRLLAQLLRTWKARFGAALLGLFVLVAVLAPVISPYDPRATTFGSLAPVSFRHPLGTTSYGQDILSQTIWGSRQSLLIGFAGGLGATLIGLIFGITAAYLGGIADHTLSFFTDIFLVLPGLPFMIIAAAYVPHRGTLVLIAVIVVTGWAFGARQLRAQALSLRHRDFVEAARARGERSSYIIAMEIVPTMIPLLAATFLNAALYSVLAAAGLQFLGLGDVTSISWGTMLYWAQNNEALNSGGALWAIVPGACIGLLGASLAFLNYGFDEIANPALRSRRKRRG
jgi:peptide/nickel transport system permease protein